MTRPDAETAARALVAERFPDARQAWLGGSVAAGTTTATSDLDVTVLLPDDAAVTRESLTRDGWPVELFVHTETSVHHFVAQDLARRRPSMARLVAAAVPLLPGDGGRAVRRHCEAVLAAGPPPLEPADLDARRYHLTDQLDDLAGTAPATGPALADQALVVEVWRLTAELLLATAPWWHGSGKWLAREVQALDEQRGTDHATRLAHALGAALAGDRSALVSCADAVLAPVGGRLRDGYRQAARLP